MRYTVPVSEEEKKSPLYKYFLRELAPAPQEKYDAIAKGPMDPKDALQAPDLNKLFDPGYLPGEFGWCVLPDGTGTVANVTPMPNVTVEMFDWWFAWHGVQPMRYKIWDPEDHFYCQTRNMDQALDGSLTMKERYWNTTHDVKESMLGDGEEHASDIVISFRDPADVGFDPEKLKDFKGTIVCAGGPENPVIMCHFVRPLESGGIELRTRFWFGYAIIGGRPVKVLPEGMRIPEKQLEDLLTHNVREYTNMAAILPEVYAEFKDQFAPF